MERFATKRAYGREVKELIYRMSKKLFKELSKSLEHGSHDATQPEVMDYMNQTFGLRGTITQLRLI